jgi:predicted secreted protein
VALRESAGRWRIGAIVCGRIEANKEVGMQVAASHRSEQSVALSFGMVSESGHATKTRTISPIFSVVKGALAVAAHVQAASYWPEFSEHCMHTITLRDVFSHQADVP